MRHARCGRTHNSWRSSFTLLSTSMILEPDSSCMTRPDVMMGEMPSSMHVPRLDAMMTRAQYSGSAPLAAWMP